ncbi:MAG: MFS transporter [Pseudonocardiaceae bacterium]|nr:MFS transporter [Pseudonocardiaceae bacterium]
MSQESSTSRVSLADYRTALTAPGARWPVLTSLLGRLPIAMIGISALLYTQRQTGSFATAGLVSAGTLIGVALGSVIQGRVMDRLGPTRPLLAMAGAFTVALVGLTMAIETRAPDATLVTLAVVVGLTQPMVASSSRAIWTRLLPAGPARTAAFSYEAISMEVFFILGPGIAGVLIAAPWAGTGLVAGGACMLIGALGFALSPAVRAWRAAPGSVSGSRLLGALASPGMRTVAVAALGFGVVIGFVEVAVPAAATRAGEPALGGLMLSLWSLSSVIFGVAYSLRPWPRPMHLRLPVLLAGFAALVALLALPGTLWGLAALMLLAGTLITPQSTAHSASIEIVSSPGAMTEAFGWVITAVTLGLSAGQSVSGILVEHGGPGLSFLAAAVAGLLLAGLVWAMRRTVAASIGPVRGDVVAAH